ncbi:hypothetical protein SE956_17505 [Escherichia coli]|nr:hypothetical protein [Escherichia coli]
MTQSDPRRQLVETLTRWDGINLLNDDGKTWQQPGSAILNVWLTSMLKRTVVAAVPMPFDKWYSASGYETTQDGPTGSLNISVGAKILYEAVQETNHQSHRRLICLLGNHSRRLCWLRWKIPGRLFPNAMAIM